MLTDSKRKEKGTQGEQIPRETLAVPFPGAKKLYVLFRSMPQVKICSQELFPDFQRDTALNIARKKGLTPHYFLS